MALTAQTGSIITTSDAPAKSSGNMTLSAHDQIFANAPLTAGSTLTLQTTAGVITLSAGALTQAAGLITIASGAGINDQAAVTSTGGAISMNAQGGYLTIAAGANIASATDISLTSNHAINLSANVASSVGSITFVSPTVLGADVTANAPGAGGNITFESTINGAQALTLDAGNNVNLQAAVGSITPLTALIINSGNELNADVSIAAGHFTPNGGSGTTLLGPIVTTGGNITVAAALHSAGPVVLTAMQLIIEPAGDITGGAGVTLTGSTAFTMQNGATIAATNGSNLVITSDDPNLGSVANSLLGTGILVLQPASDGTQIDVGGAGPAFDLTDAEIATIGNQFTQVIIGRGTGNGFDSVAAGGNVSAPHVINDNGSGQIFVHSAVFNDAVTLRSAAATAPVVINGSLTTTGNNSSITVIAGNFLIVDGTVSVGGSGDITLTAAADGLGAGGVLIADQSNTTVSAANGNIHLNGAIVAIGSASATPTISAPNGSIDIETPSASAGGSIVITNANSQISAGQNLSIGSDAGTLPPASIQIQGNLTTAHDIVIQTTGDANFDQFRARSGGRIDVLANNNIATANGTFIATGGAVDLLADADHNGSGAVTQTGLDVSQPSTLSLDTGINSVKIAPTLRPSDQGKSYVTLTNTATTTAKGYITLVMYASPIQTLQATDQVIGRLHLYINLKPGASKRVLVPIKIPTTVAPGNYYIGLEQLPYSGIAVSGARGGVTVIDPNVSFTSQTVQVLLPQLTGSIHSTFDGKTISPGQTGKVTVTIKDSGAVRSLGFAKVDLYVSPDGLLDDAIRLHATIKNSVKLKVGQSLSIPVHVTLPYGLDSTQSYRIIAVIQPLTDAVNPALPSTTLVSTSAFSIPASARRAA
jgi:hypothetical protein